MNYQPTGPTGNPQANMMITPDMLIAVQMNRIKGSGQWFYWIAGLSLLNSITLHAGTNVNFLIGLRSTLELSVNSIIYPDPFNVMVSLIIIVILLGFYALMGYFASKGMLWAFIVGGIFYLLDGLYCLARMQWFSAIFHVLALYYIYLGIKAIGEIEKVKAQQIVALARAPMPPPYQPAQNEPSRPPAPDYTALAQPEAGAVREEETTV